MDVETVDREYQQLEQEAQQLATAIQQLAEKMQGASAPASQQYISAPQANYAPSGGGVLSRFRTGGFGQAMSQGLGMGAGFSLADSVINAIFNR